MRKVCVVITSRASYSRFKTALIEIKKHHALELQLVLAASALLDRYGKIIDTIKQDGFEVKREVYSIIEGESLLSMAKTAGNGILELTSVFNDLKPDCVVTVADRYETMSTAISASYMNIPLVHIQGGEITGNIDEKVRHAITKLADLHLVSTEKAKERVIKMGEDPGSVIVTGCPSIDIAKEVSQSMEMDFDPIKKYGGVGSDIVIQPKKYVVMLQHPLTTAHEEAREHVTMSLEILKELGHPTLVFWPNVDAGSDGTSKGIRTFREFGGANNIRYYKNMYPSDFLKLLCNSMCLIGNSSVGIRECSYLGVPVVNIGDRQRKRDRGRNVIDVKHDTKAIRTAIDQQIENGHYQQDHVYGDGNAGVKIAQAIADFDLTFDKVLSYN